MTAIAQKNLHPNHPANRTLKRFTKEQRDSYNEKMHPYYFWCVQKTKKHKYLASARLFLDSIVSCCNENGISEVGLEAFRKKCFEKHGVKISQRTAERLIETFKKDKLIHRKPLKNKWTKIGKFCCKTYSTKLLAEVPAKMADIIYTSNILDGSGKLLALPEPIPSTPESPPPLDAVSAPELHPYKQNPDFDWSKVPKERKECLKDFYKTLKGGLLT